MIRLYFDWLVFSKLKTPEFSDLRHFLIDNLDGFIIPFTPTHFKDSEPSHEDPRFLPDLETMTQYCDGHFIFFEEDTTYSRWLTAKEAFSMYKPVRNPNDEPFDFLKAIQSLDDFLADNGQPRIGQLLHAPLNFRFGYNEAASPRTLKALYPMINENTTFLDLAQNFFSITENFFHDKSSYLNVRSALQIDGASFGTKTANMSSQEAYEEILKTLKADHRHDSYRAFIDTSYKGHAKKPNQLDWFKHAYQMLDILGYKPDPLRKPTNTAMNIQNDAEHAFYAQTCDYLVTDDRTFKAKAEVLYMLLDINTIVIDPMDLTEEMKAVTLPIPKSCADFIEQVVKEYRHGIPIQYENDGTEIPAGTMVRATVFPILNYFTHIICYRATADQVELQLRAVYDNKPRFSYGKEIKVILRQLISTFGSSHIEDVDALITQMIESKEPPALIWPASGSSIIVEMEKEHFRPTVRIFMFREAELPEAPVEEA